MVKHRRIVRSLEDHERYLQGNLSMNMQQWVHLGAQSIMKVEAGHSMRVNFTEQHERNRKLFLLNKTQVAHPETNS